jgi:hypothetical protein
MRNKQKHCEEGSMSYKAKVLDAGIILGVLCSCILGVLLILSEALKRLMER